MARDSGSPDEMESAELYAACAGGDIQRQRIAYEQLWRYLFRVALYVLSSQPEPEAVAADVAQAALVRVNQRLEQCREPAAFRTWARRIATHLAIDTLRRRKRLVPMEEPGRSERNLYYNLKSDQSAEQLVASRMNVEDLADLLNQAPISDRSRRVVIGRYLDDTPDEVLAEAESHLAGREVLPSHIQVTRSKNIAKLREYEPLRRFLLGEET